MFKKHVRRCLVLLSTLGCYFVTFLFRKEPSKQMLYYLVNPAVQLTQLIFMPLFTVIAMRMYRRRMGGAVHNSASSARLTIAGNLAVVARAAGDVHSALW